MINSKGTIEDWAKKFVEEQHPGYKLDFEKSVKRILYSNCFNLKIDISSHLSLYYLIIPTGMLLSENSEPYHEKLKHYFCNEETIPRSNYWIGFVEIDENFFPVKTQRFKIPQIEC